MGTSSSHCVKAYFAKPEPTECASPAPMALKRAITRNPRMARIRNAGIDAMAHFTMKATIEPNGMSMSVTLTSDGAPGAAGDGTIDARTRIAR